jgi:glutamine synthetase
MGELMARKPGRTRSPDDGECGRAPRREARGRLDLRSLTRLIETGEIDTVIVCMTDMQGRLVGKRVTGHFFLESAVTEAHGCDYLLTVDMEMEPVPGYKAASWDLGYGDFAMKPDLGTLRRIPWLEGTALVLCDVVDHHGRELPHSPRAILKRQIARAREQRFVAKMGAELELYVFDEGYESARARDYKGLKHAGWYIEDYHILQTTKEEGLIRAIRNFMDAAGIPVEVSKGEWGPGQEEINLEYAEPATASTCIPRSGTPGRIGRCSTTPRPSAACRPCSGTTSRGSSLARAR